MIKSFFNPPSVAAPSQPLPVVAPYFVTSDEDGVVIAQSAPPKQQLVYGHYDPKTELYAATLSPYQIASLSRLIQTSLSIPTTPLNHVFVSSGKGLFTVGFFIDPRKMGSETVITLGQKGLTALFQSGIKNGYTWDVAESEVEWPSWLVPHRK